MARANSAPNFQADQKAALETLVWMIDLGNRAKLPPLRWTISTARLIFGQVLHGSAGPSPGVIWQQWSELLGDQFNAVAEAERTTDPLGGSTRLSGQWLVQATQTVVKLSATVPKSIQPDDLEERHEAQLSEVSDSLPATVARLEDQKD